MLFNKRGESMTEQDELMRKNKMLLARQRKQFRLEQERIKREEARKTRNTTLPEIIEKEGEKKNG